MTDKRIIDGIDVSKCEHFQLSCIPDYSGGHLYKNVCRNNGFYNCEKKPCAFKCKEYLKQLKQKEQECDNSQLQIDNLQHDIGVFTRQLEKANKEVCQEKEKNAVLRQKLEQQEQECENYKQALDEIEKLATIREVHGLSDTEYVENFRFHQERISGIINKAKEQ